MVNFPSWQMQYITGVYKPQNSDAVTGSNENGDVNIFDKKKYSVFINFSLIKSFGRYGV